jgi:HPt (histidine-containing phosphotransfer) domain-containing protein
MNDYLSKPVDPVALERCLRRWLAPVEPPASPADDAPGRAARLARLAQVQGLDAPAALARLSGNEALYRRMLQMFIAHHGADDERLLELQRRGEPSALRALAHALAGAASAIGARTIEQGARALLAATAATAAVDGAARDATRALALVLHQGLDALRAALADGEAPQPPRRVGPDPAASAPIGPGGPQAASDAARATLQQLRPLLASHDTAALPLFERERARLGRVLGAGVEELGRHLNAFDFGAALRCLQQLIDHDGTAG